MPHSIPPALGPHLFMLLNFSTDQIEGRPTWPGHLELLSLSRAGLPLAFRSQNMPNYYINRNLYY